MNKSLLSTILMALTIILPTKSWAQEPYAALSDNNTVLTFYYDDQKAARNGIDIEEYTLWWDSEIERATTYSGWDDERENITNVVFDTSFANCTTLTSTAFWFYGFTSLTSITGISNLKTDNMTDIGSMFENCSSLTSIDISRFNTSKVTNMSRMFSGCSSLTSLDLRGFNTTNVIYFNAMFLGCSALTNLDLSNFNTANAKNMSELFEGCSGLTTLNVIGFKTDNVTSMGYMFYGCSGLTSLDLSSFNTSNVTDMNYMFYGCSGLSSLDLSSFNTANIEYMANMFLFCSGLTTIYVGDGWSTEKLTNGGWMFDGCTRLVGGRGTRYDPDHVNADYAHIDGGMANPGYFTGKNVSEPIIVNLINNSDMEGDDYGNFYFRRILELNKALPQPISNNVGVNGSRGIRIETTDRQENGYDNEFWISLNQPVSEGTRFKLTYDYRTDQDARVYIGAHGPAFFGDFIWDWMEPYVYFETEWRTYTMEGIIDSSVSSDQKPLGSLAFSLNETPEANTYYFDNVKFEVYLEDQCPKPTFVQKEHENEVSIHSPFNATIYYTLDGSTPTTRSSVYTAPLSFTQNTTIKAIAVVEGYETSPVATYLYEPTENNVSFDGLTAWVSGEATLDDAFAEVGGREEAAKTIAAIIWENTTALTADMLQGINNPNLLVYVNEPSLAPQGVQNVVVNGIAQEIILTDATSGNNNFFCPQAFTAERISYTRNFGQQTEVGVSRGWESIALPFTVQEITHENKGQITPFGANGTKHFWLRGYSPDGLYSAATLEANKPYVISMPNNTVVYPDAYNLNGRVTFSASNTTVPATPPLEEMMVVRDNIIMMPTFQYIPQNEYVYAVNVGQARERYAEGSVFARDLRDVRPFEAYTTHGERNGARPNFIRIAAQPSNESVGIRDIKTDSAESAWYSIDGRKLQGEPQRKGVYIQKGKKIRVK